MLLNGEQQAVLDGEAGRALGKAMAALVAYGDAFAARRLVPIKSAHLAGTFGAAPFTAYYSVLAWLVAEGATCRGPGCGVHRGRSLREDQYRRPRVGQRRNGRDRCNGYVRALTASSVG